MNERRYLVITIAGLSVIAAGLGILLLVPRQDKTPAVITTGLTEEQTKEILQIQNYLRIRPSQPQDERIVLFGGNLVGQKNGEPETTLRTVFKRQVEVDAIPGGTSFDAMLQLQPVLDRPPKVLVFDLGRFDGDDGFSIEKTINYLTVIDQKLRELKVQTVYLLGLSSDGNTLFADTLRSSVRGVKTLDLSDLLMLSRYRESPTVLNEEGAKMFAKKLQDYLSLLLTT